MANNQFTDEDRKLFHKIEADIKKNCFKYSEAGKWLDQFYDVAKFWQEKVEHLQTLNEICKSHKECECTFCREAEWLSWVIEKRNFTSQDEYIEISDMEQEFREGLFKEEVPPIYRLLEAKGELTSQYISNCGMLSDQDAKCIYLTNWLLISPESRNDTDIEITKFQRYELKDLEGVIYSRMGLFFSTQRDIEEWMKMIKTSQHKLDFMEENKAKHKAETPAKTEQDTRGARDTYNIIAEDTSIGDKAQHAGRDINTTRPEPDKKKRILQWIALVGVIVSLLTFLFGDNIFGRREAEEEILKIPTGYKVEGIIKQHRNAQHDFVNEKLDDIYKSLNEIFFTVSHSPKDPKSIAVDLTIFFLQTAGQNNDRIVFEGKMSPKQGVALYDWVEAYEDKNMYDFSSIPKLNTRVGKFVFDFTHNEVLRYLGSQDTGNEPDNVIYNDNIITESMKRFVKEAIRKIYKDRFPADFDFKMLKAYEIEREYRLRTFKKSTR